MLRLDSLTRKTGIRCRIMTLSDAGTLPRCGRRFNPFARSKSLRQVTKLRDAA